MREVAPGYCDPPVTAHAVLRYLTRIEGFDIAPTVRRLGRAAGNLALAKAASEDFGVHFLAVQRRICPQHLDAAVRAGAARVRRQGFVLICAAGTVVTVSEERHAGKLKTPTRRELKRGAQRLDRRWR